VSARYCLLTTMCRRSLRSLAVQNRDGPLMAPADWGGAEGAGEVKESRPIATLLATLGLAACSC
jgi:hypothetical protein